MANQPKSVRFFDSLPDHILCRILSFLPTKDAARTSVLSPRWRYLFLSSISILDFMRCLGRCVRGYGDDNFLNFVDRFFSSPVMMSLECFRVSFGSLVDENLRIHGWVCAALRRGIKEIDMESLDRKIPLTLPSLLFTCHSLVTLRLEGFVVNGVPTNACLPNLKTLHFSFLEFLDARSVLGFISASPALEDLDFVRCGLLSDIIICSLSLKRLVLVLDGDKKSINAIKLDAPNLVSLHYLDVKAEEYTLTEVNSLESAVISITLVDNKDLEHAANLLQKTCNIQTLHLRFDNVSTSFCRVALDPMLAFNNLVELGFQTRIMCDWEGTWFMEFLHCMPNLITLNLNLEAGRMRLPTTVPWCLLFQIKTIEIMRFDGGEHMLELISYFLKHASVLELLIISNFRSNMKDSNIIEKLFSLPKKSKKCDIRTPPIFETWLDTSDMRYQLV